MTEKSRQKRAAYAAKWFKAHPEWHRNYYHSVAKQQFWSLKASNPCTDCAEWYQPWQMEFDHLPAFKKEFQINVGHQLNTRDFAEIAKCQLVCANCHNDRTYKRGHA